MEQADRAFGLVLIWILAATNLDLVACDAVRENEPERRVNKGLNTAKSSTLSVSSSTDTLFIWDSFWFLPVF